MLGICFFTYAANTLGSRSVRGKGGLRFFFIAIYLIYFHSIIPTRIFTASSVSWFSNEVDKEWTAIDLSEICRVGGKWLNSLFYTT